MFAISTLIMKRLLLTTCILGLVILGNAQNYQCVKTDAVSHFECTNGLIYSIRIDSVAQRNDTTDYYSYKLVRKLENAPMLFTMGDPWIGEKFSVIPGNINSFYNKAKQEIIINTAAGLNETWQMYYSTSDNIRIIAEIVVVDTLWFAGICDSVKTIKIHVYNNEGNLIENPFQNSLLHISKNYGMLSAFNFYEFPWGCIVGGNYDYLYSITDSLQFIGMNNPELGWQNLTAGNIFDWQPGWEFHTTEGTTTTHGEYPWYDYTENIIRTVLSRNLENDTLVYSIDRCYYRYTDAYGTITEDRFRDTITEKYTLHNSMNLLPGESFGFDDMVQYYRKTRYTIRESGNMFYCNDNCDTLIPVFYDGACFNTYHERLGVTFKCEGGFAQPDSIGFCYYKRGDDVWGVPFVCSTLLSVPGNSVLSEKIQLFPNPVEEVTNITVQTNDVLEIFDTSGQRLMVVNLVSGDNLVNVAHLHPGLYLFRSKNSGVCIKVIVK